MGQLDPNSGTISSFADPTIVVDIQGTAPGNKTPVQLNAQVLGRPYQSWNWLGNPGYIQNNGAPSFCIDDTGQPSPGVGVYLWTQANGNVNQMFTFTPVPALERAAVAAATK